MTMTIARLNIEVPINMKKRYAQQSCISNLLVTVFANLTLTGNQDIKHPNNLLTIVLQPR